jgi:hypothetical protein
MGKCARYSIGQGGVMLSPAGADTVPTSLRNAAQPFVPDFRRALTTIGNDREIDDTLTPLLLQTVLRETGAISWQEPVGLRPPTKRRPPFV